MFKFIAGVVVTLAVLYPDNTKVILGQAVDIAHHSLSGVIAVSVDQTKK